MGAPASEAAAGPWTVDALRRAGIERLRRSGSELPRLDAELLLGHSSGLRRVDLVAHPETPVPGPAAHRYEAALARRERGEPVAYIRGMKEFWGLALTVDARALIPRPETERLVELAVTAARVSIGAAQAGRRARIVDVGTGSGAVVVALASALRARGLLERTEMLATDRSAAALELAAENLASQRLVDVVRLVEADLLPAGGAAFDIVLANLPYVPTADVPRLPLAASFEPVEALDGGPDGLAVIRRLLALLPVALAPGGVALVEIGADQADLVVAAVAGLVPGARVTVEPDLGGLPRVAVIQAQQQHSVKHSEPDRSGISRSAPRHGTGSR